MFFLSTKLKKKFKLSHLLDNLDDNCIFANNNFFKLKTKNGQKKIF